jgi:hypothetical protein
VVLTFDDNPRRVGVRFDKPIPGGLSLGGLCEDGHGFFVDAAELRPDDAEANEAIALEVLFEIANSEEACPLHF